MLGSKIVTFGPNTLTTAGVMRRSGGGTGQCKRASGERERSGQTRTTLCPLGCEAN